MTVLPSYINQPTDLLCKSIDWFLHEGITFNGLTDSFGLRITETIPDRELLLQNNNKNTRKIYKVCLNLTIKTPERNQ